MLYLSRHLKNLTHGNRLFDRWQQGNKKNEDFIFDNYNFCRPRLYKLKNYDPNI